MSIEYNFIIILHPILRFITVFIATSIRLVYLPLSVDHFSFLLLDMGGGGGLGGSLVLD